MKTLIIGFVILLFNYNYNRIHKATWYGESFHGKRTASGEIYNKWAMTCAYNYAHFGDSLIVTNIYNGKSVVVKVNDRISKKYNNRIDLSKRAFKQIAKLKDGVIKVKIEAK